MAAPDRRFLSPDTLPAPFGYSHVVDAPASRIVYVSGQVPLDTEGQLVGEGDFEAQVRQVFANLTAALVSSTSSTSTIWLEPPRSTWRAGTTAPRTRASARR